MKALAGAALLAALCQAADPPKGDDGKKEFGAREYFWVNRTANEAMPPISRVKSTTTATKAAPAAKHLGLRYNLALVNAKTGQSQPVDSDRIFHAGECFAIDFESNHSGYLYVFAKQSSGAWQPLVPSPEMPDESNVIDPGRKVRVPAQYCFEIHDPAGAETLFVALSRDPRDLSELIQKMQGTPAAPAQEHKPARPEPEQRPANMQMADARLVNAAVEHLTQQFGTRDIAIRKVSVPTTRDEPRGSVYVANASETPSSSVVTQIVVRHR